LHNSGYGCLDRLLHGLALGFVSIAEMSFDLDQRLVTLDLGELVRQRHVFVSGLARSGTTILMRRFHATGEYRSLTYRDMPFVLAPNLWQRLASLSSRDAESSERAHGDRIFVDADSPESFDEVFWRVFAGDEYLAETHLSPHRPSRELADKYVRYVGAIVQSAQQDRYLSKNNNNILRLDAISRAFPDAAILLPLRDPVQHALSLLLQHRRFSRLQEEDAFVLRYMNWLGHHEFGLGHRPFVFDDSEQPGGPTGSLDYWLALWCGTYEWLERSKPESAIFVCYEDLCASRQVWSVLAEWAGVSRAAGAGEPFELHCRDVVTGVDPKLAARAAQIYRRLQDSARAALGYGLPKAGRTAYARAQGFMRSSSASTVDSTPARTAGSGSILKSGE
jgi:hypothetical protein